MKKVLKKIVEVLIIAVVTASAMAAASNSYRSFSDIPNLVVQYTNGVITDLVDSRGNLVGLVTSTNNQTVNTIGLTGGATLCNSTAPTIGSGFGASAVIANANGSCTFQVSVGTVSLAASGVLNMPTAVHGWNCFASQTALQASAVEIASSTSASQVTITNYAIDSGATLTLPSSGVLAVACSGY